MTDTEKLALALAAIEAAKETINGMVRLYTGERTGKPASAEASNEVAKSRTAFIKAVTKLEAAK